MKFISLPDANKNKNNFIVVDRRSARYARPVTHLDIHLIKLILFSSAQQSLDRAAAVGIKERFDMASVSFWRVCLVPVKGLGKKSVNYPNMNQQTTSIITHGLSSFDSQSIRVSILRIVTSRKAGSMQTY